MKMCVYMFTSYILVIDLILVLLFEPTQMYLLIPWYLQFFTHSLVLTLSSH